ncbi:hypothetical protein A3A84_02470 [Candidatus Collierbacteria bacterium RIFCSPLOWO2_01_FULL_50_23]|uniref:Uncharacterized protein n=2 Tax=Candidatus Collieribacteriota TaxID=1752725 RepID=A0A1F5ETJ6_9BACT|nr:MAG: hypothetical protein A3D09_00930 [Candidatus Collierbacteria bacterium RIFCSPHIGHO2_02_FULL_49_10]OGD72256.1 MAG: hypothetical protein A2703_02730 [Candidatus Collierbacteria bacterium RIFCSPHIGHO2_01_FULL_50_25]OGD73821.1 MAG: hypothetical protein A3A84_02470 [Candidatus Collierbacteria bacterium RIFCSPLOWO2_01_FULL_50_23]
MEITFLGKNSFKFKTKTLTLVIDPISSKEKADVVIYTTPQAAHAGGQAGRFEISGAVNREKTFVIDKEGEYELGGVGIIADRVEIGKEGMVVRISGDGVEVAHTGALVGDPDEKMKQKLSEIDVLLVTLTGGAGLIDACEPYLAVLMGYDAIGEVDHFLSTNKFEVVKRDMDKLKLDADSLPESTEVVVLNG